MAELTEDFVLLARKLDETICYYYDIPFFVSNIDNYLEYGDIYFNFEGEIIVFYNKKLELPLSVYIEMLHHDMGFKFFNQDF